MWAQHSNGVSPSRPLTCGGPPDPCCVPVHLPACQTPIEQGVECHHGRRQALLHPVLHQGHLSWAHHLRWVDNAAAGIHNPVLVCSQ